MNEYEIYTMLNDVPPFMYLFAYMYLLFWFILFIFLASLVRFMYETYIKIKKPKISIAPSCDICPLYDAAYYYDYQCTAKDCRSSSRRQQRKADRLEAEERAFTENDKI